MELGGIFVSPRLAFLQKNVFQSICRDRYYDCGGDVLLPRSERFGATIAAKRHSKRFGEFRYEQLFRIHRSLDNASRRFLNCPRDKDCERAYGRLVVQKSRDHKNQGNQIITVDRSGNGE